MAKRLRASGVAACLTCVAAAIAQPVEPNGPAAPAASPPAREPFSPPPVPADIPRGTPNELVFPSPARTPLRSPAGIAAPQGIAFGSGRVYPEGSFITARPGRVLITPMQDVIFVPDVSEKPEPPMVLLPCELLARLTSALAAMPDAVVTLTGQVYVYHDRHYVLPTAFAVGSRQATPPAEPQGATPPPAAPAAGPASLDDAAVKDLIKDLESRRTPQRTLDTTSRGSGQEEAVELTREGTFLMNRRGRIIRRPEDGRFAAAFDNDAGSPAPGAMTLMPCRVLEGLERLAAWRGENTPFVMSGRVYQHNGRNYLLPILARPVRPGDIRPLQ